MNKFFTLLLAITLAASLSINAASYTTKKGSVLSVDPVDFINGRINLTYEKKLSTNNSFTINGSFWSYYSYLTAFGAGASYRWYLDPFEESKTALNGLSVGPRADIYFWSYDNHGIDHSYSTVAIGAEVNYKWAFSDKWSIEPTIKFMFPVKKEKGYDFYRNYGFGVNIGYCF